MTIRQDLAQNDTRIITGVFNEIIDKILTRNGYKTEERPLLIPVRKEAVDAVRAQRDEALSRTNVKFTKKYYMRAYDLNEDDFVIVEEQDVPANSGTKKKPSGNVIRIPKGQKVSDT